MATSTSTSSESSTSTSTTSSEATSSCSSKQECQKPASSSLSTEVGIAVAVPVAVVLLVLGFVFYKVYKRNKKEELEDNDPDFDGDAEYLPDFGDQFEMQRKNDLVGEKVGGYRKDMFSSQPNPFMDDTPSVAYSNGPPLNPFRLPSSTDDTETLRNFAKNLQDGEFGGYQFATHSASQLSLSRPSSAAGGNTYNRVGNPYTHTISSNSGDMRTGKDEPILKYSEVMGSNTGSSDNDVNMNVPGIPYSKDVAGSSSSVEGVSREERSFERESVDLEESPVKFTRGTVTQSYINDDVEGLQPELSMLESDGNPDTKMEAKKPFLDDLDDDVYIGHSDPNVDENVERMKSIYQVYLDRNGTVKTIKDGEEVPAGFHPSDELPADASNIIEQNVGSTFVNDKIENEGMGSQLQGRDNEFESVAEDRKLVGGINTDQPTLDSSPAGENGDKFFEAKQYVNQSDNSYPQQDYFAQQDSTTHVNDNHTSVEYAPRVASSIYDTNPEHDYHPHNEGQQYYRQPLFTEQYDGTYPGYSHVHHVHHNAPPPIQEHIQKLPSPSELSLSPSTHSLTSFRVRPNGSKQTAIGVSSQLQQQGYNPIDHPELYFHQTNGIESPSFSDVNSHHTSSSQAPSSNPKILPHHLRQSVVMTNSDELSQNNFYKPAGSFSRAISDSRSNSLMSNGNGYHQHLQETYIKSRVSGILDDTDVSHQTSMGNILPHSGSQGDLRKQLGVSHNYQVV